MKDPLVQKGEIVNKVTLNSYSAAAGYDWGIAGNARLKAQSTGPDTSMLSISRVQ